MDGFVRERPFRPGYWFAMAMARGKRVERTLATMKPTSCYSIVNGVLSSDTPITSTHQYVPAFIVYPFLTEDDAQAFLESRLRLSKGVSLQDALKRACGAARELGKHFFYDGKYSDVVVSTSKST